MKLLKKLELIYFNLSLNNLISKNPKIHFKI